MHNSKLGGGNPDLLPNPSRRYAPRRARHLRARKMLLVPTRLLRFRPPGPELRHILDQSTSPSQRLPGPVSGPGRQSRWPRGLQRALLRNLRRLSRPDGRTDEILLQNLRHGPRQSSGRPRVAAHDRSAALRRQGEQAALRLAEELSERKDVFVLHEAWQQQFGGLWQRVARAGGLQLGPELC